MTANATPQPSPDGVEDCWRAIVSIVARPGLVADTVALAAMLHFPDLVAAAMYRLRPSDWRTDLHRITARIALSHLRAMGRADLRQMIGVLEDAGTIGPDALRIELEELARVAELIRAECVVVDAIAALIARRPGAVA